MISYLSSTLSRDTLLVSCLACTVADDLPTLGRWSCVHYSLCIQPQWQTWLFPGRT
ncbi:hypothetical protein BDZ85DRAFT_260494 [Elsinoe ampelina]|uniref:Uncharacterized protein n=1 Tax=Elsinoe ampelina TaxID=302913 RepID=A0A6A6GF59_9PEZI|nr:hypothetical protein BDZ85DRAFT_260494 [Elsinoe ampelina]